MFTFFLTSCVEASPSKCALAKMNKTAAALEQHIWAFFDAHVRIPITYGPYLAESGFWKSLTAVHLHDSKDWSDAAETLAKMV